MLKQTNRNMKMKKKQQLNQDFGPKIQTQLYHFERGGLVIIKDWNPSKGKSLINSLFPDFTLDQLTIRDPRAFQRRNFFYPFLEQF